MLTIPVSIFGTISSALTINIFRKVPSYVIILANFFETDPGVLTFPSSVFDAVSSVL